jgi:quercetin dioxygenase-like cupin family protein
MICVELNKVTLRSLWTDEDPDIRQRAGYITHLLAGARSSATVYIELEPGARVGRHRHSAEETILVIEGDVEVTVGGESRTISGPGLAVAPALVRHDVHCVGEHMARCVGFWSSSSVVSLWDTVLQPTNSRRTGTPIPEEI